MLDLHARVHLDEIEAAVLVEELEGTGAAIADGATGLRTALADLAPLCLGNAGRGGLLDDLLVAALHGAVALAEMDGVAVLVRKHLELDMTRVLQILLHIDHIVVEGRGGLRLGQRDGVQ